MAQKPSSNTMEINSILEEARSRNKSLSESRQPVTRAAAPARRTAAPAVSKKQLDDTDYVDISSQGT